MRFISMLMLMAVVALAVGFKSPEKSGVATAPPAATPALLAFEKFKSLAGGTWEARKKDGLVCHVTYQVIAGGSCVMETFEFADQPERTMVTMFHLNGPDLMLTHYCMVGNQPRMQATELASDGSKALFTFKDGTNLASRDEGHMDKASFTFVDADHFSSRWTWYESGQEEWMEEFTYARKK